MAERLAGRARSERWVELESLVLQCPHGALLTYHDIELHTGVVMDRAGKGMLRKVLRSRQREWLCTPRVGIELASVDTSLQVVQKQLRKSVHGIQRTAEAHTNVEPFYAELPAEDQRYARMIGIAMGTWVAVAHQMEERLLSQRKHTALLTQIKANMGKTAAP